MRNQKPDRAVETASVTSAEIKAVLEGGVKPGDTLLVHSSLSAIGWHSDGIPALISLLLELVGEKGNLVMLASSRQFTQTGFFDVNQSPVDIGALAEAFRLYPGVRRSLNPMVSFCAIGPDSDQFLHTFDHYLDKQSPFMALLALGGKVMLYGVDYNRCTLYHLSEERAGSDYNFYKTFEGTVRDHQGVDHPCSQTYFVRRDMTLLKDARPVGRKFEQSNAVFRASLGGDWVRVFDARLFDNFCSEQIADNPRVFIASDQ